ncbi:MAG: Gfo/Idh/MocA family oxidoreductase, partial [Cyclobacteriaceae bacterium]|nr:Gfo/Idh/MocA family oxidoreductase [Cyclobacteriaceae bacterium]
MRSRFYKRQKRNGSTWSNFTRSERSGNINRRNFIKDLSVLPVSGVIGHEIDKMKSEPIIFSSQRNNKSIKIGIIGFGFRGEQLARATKHAHPDWIKEQEEAHKKDSRNKVLEDFYSQQDLNVEIVAVCDVFDVRIERGIAVGGKNTQGFNDYRKLLAQKDIDVVIISTPDHWHMQMGIDAANAGKHVYMEKCMTRTAKEAVQLKKSIKDNSIVFQLGHQGRQSDLQKKAKGLYEKGTLGKVTLVETTTNRNNPFAAWIWPIHEKASDKTIDWERFQEPAPKKVPYNAERFFRWRCWWD